MTEAVETSPERSRELLLAAMSAAGAAVSGMAEALRHPPERSLGEVFALGHGETVPLEEEVFEPLVDALRLAANAVGLPQPLHRITVALDRFTSGEDD